MMSLQRTFGIPLLAVTAASAALVLGAPGARAHVSAEGEATAGERSTVSFRVPNESDTADTTRVKVVFPADHPLAQVTPQAVPGWTITVTKEKLAAPLDNHGEPITEAVTAVEWRAGSIPPGQFQVFGVRIGPLPSGVDELVFKTVQSYSDGSVVRWIDEQEPGLPEPERPAPTLEIHPHTAQDVHDEGDRLARGLGAAGLTAGLVALAVALTQRLRRTALPSGSASMSTEDDSHGPGTRAEPAEPQDTARV